MTLEPVEDLEALRDDWGALAFAACNVFATPEFHELWWRHLGAGPRRVYALRDGDVTAALLPFHVAPAGPLRLVRFAGHEAGDELGPICRPADRQRALAALPSLLASLRGHVFVGEQLPAEVSLLGARQVSAEGSPLASLAGGWDAYLAGRSRNLREQVRRRERRLRERFEVDFRLAGEDSLDRDLDTLFSLHRLRWGGRTTPFAAREAFHRDFARTAFARDWLRLWTLELDGRAAAAWLGFRFAGAESYYQLGRDPALDEHSVGFVLLAHTMRAAAADGLEEYRFLRGDEPYKYRFATADPGLRTVALARGPLGRAALTGALAARRLRRLSRRPERVGG